MAEARLWDSTRRTRTSTVCDDKEPNFGSPVDRVTRFCGPHREEGRVNVQNKMCAADGFEKQASYSSEAEDLPRFCSSHSRDGASPLAAAAVRGARLR